MTSEAVTKIPVGVNGAIRLRNGFTVQISVIPLSASKDWRTPSRTEFYQHPVKVPDHYAKGGVQLPAPRVPVPPALRLFLTRSSSPCDPFRQAGA